MAFNNEIRVLNTSDTNHADNFNEPMRQLLENTQFNAKQIGVLSEDTLGCGFGKNLVHLGRNVDLKGFNKNIMAVCTTTINNPSNFYDGDSSFVNVKYFNQDWQDVTFISFKDGLEWKIFKRADGWGEWNCDSNKITALQETDITLPYLVKDFNSIPFNKRHIRSEASIPNAPTVGQFTGIQTAWDDAFKMTLGIDIFGGLFYRKGFDKWKQVATTDKIDISLTLLNNLTGTANKVKTTTGAVDINLDAIIIPTNGLAPFTNITNIGETPYFINETFKLNFGEKSYFCVIKGNGMIENQTFIPAGTYYGSKTIIVR